MYVYIGTHIPCMTGKTAQEEFAEANRQQDAARTAPLRFPTPAHPITPPAQDGEPCHSLDLLS